MISRSPGSRVVASSEGRGLARPPRPRLIGMSSGSTERSARITSGVTCPQLTISSLNVAGIPASDDRGHLGRRAGHLAQRPVHEHQRLVGGAAAAPAGAQRPERDRAARGGARAGTEAVGERDPHPVEVLDEVEPVARDLVAGQHVARQLAAADPGDAGREQALLDLGRRERLLAPLASRERVRVAVGERDGGRGLARDLGERASWPAERQHHARRAPAEPERDDLDATAMREPGAQLGQAGGVQLRSDRQRHLDPLGETVRSGDAQQVRAVDVDDVQRERDLGDALRLGHELVGEQRREPRRRRRGSRRAAPGSLVRAGRRAAAARRSPRAREAGTAGPPRAGSRGRGSAGRAWTGTRRRPPRCPRPQAWATARAGGGSPRGSCSASAPCSRAGRSCRAVDAIAAANCKGGADRGRQAAGSAPRRISERCTGGARRRPGRSAARCP